MQSDTARAGFTLAVGLFAWAVIGTPQAEPLCEAPVERESVEGYTTVVACDGFGSSDAVLRGPARRLFGHRVDLNCSDPLTLQTLVGIGPARAHAIIAERDRGRYLRVDDLTRVRGIGPKTLARLRDSLVVETGPTSVESPGCRSNSGVPGPTGSG
jgi:competence ComEA-like helix-hairpin-helix protein